MSEVYPISCLACRRLKIKCNRLKSCNQCQRRNIVCEFPSTYRNTVVYGGKIERGDDGEDSTTQNLRNELRSLREYQRKVLTTNSELVQKNKELKEKLSKKGDSKKSDKGLKEGSADTVGSGIKIAGETSETGEKYYGPQSSSFMIESLKSSRTESEMATPGSELLKDEFHEKSQLLNSEMERNVNSNTPKREETQAKRNPPKTENDEMFQKSMTKKKLPYILPQPDDWGKNFGVIVILAESFFEQNEYYQTFINKLDVFDFLDGYKLIKENEWEHDDDLLLLYMILILLVVRSTPRQFSQLGLLGENDTSYNKSLKKLTKNLFFHFERLRHNLINESICTITSYILCTEWYLIEQRYEESWSMMFHTCSIAYAIGLHAMRKLRYQMVGSHLSKKKIARHDEYDDDDEEETDVKRFKVWFALKNISGQICSILGRPNPILIKVNSVILQAAAGSELPSIDISESSTQVLLKKGLSECLRLSNMMLIENFMTDFTIDDLVTLDSRFNAEISLLEWYHSDPRRLKLNVSSLSDDENPDFPNHIDSTNLLTDLIILYINRAKVFELFINKFDNPRESKKISNVLRYSILKFLDYSLLFINRFLDNYPDKQAEFVVTQSEFNKSQEDGNGPGQLRFGKLFRIYNPSLNSFVYQGIIVIFTFLHYNFKDFVNNFNHALSTDEEESPNYNNFLVLLEQRIDDLISYGKPNNNFKHIKLWSSNIIVIVEKIKKHIHVIYEKQQLKAGRESASFQQEINDFHSSLSGGQIEDYFGFNISDPFWFKNPDNFPYYLSSPSDTSNTSGSHRPLIMSASKSNSDNLGGGLLHVPQPVFPHSQNLEPNLLPVLVDSTVTEPLTVSDGGVGPGVGVDATGSISSAVYDNVQAPSSTYQQPQQDAFVHQVPPYQQFAFQQPFNVTQTFGYPQSTFPYQQEPNNYTQQYSQSPYLKPSQTMLQPLAGHPLPQESTHDSVEPKESELHNKRKWDS